MLRWQKSAASLRSSLNLRLVSIAFLSLQILACVLAFATMQKRYYPIPEEDTVLLNQRKILIAANYYNNEYMLSGHFQQVLRLIDMIFKAGGVVFVSIYENGSKDRTPAIIERFRETLRNHNVQHRIICDKLPTWTEEHDEDDMEERIKFMAQIRNEALKPLSDHSFDDVIFLNDIVFDAGDVLRLLLTEQLQYDAVCAMDFNRVTFYDTWVSRDVNGFAMAPFYPYVSDQETAELLRQNKPFPVSSCWNGAIVIKAAALASIKFRKWEPNESRTIQDSQTYVYNTECPVSECTLLFKDLTLRGYSKFLINPTVHVTYSYTDWALHWVFGELLNLFARTFLKIDAQPRIPEADRIPSCDTTGKVAFRFWPTFFLICLALAVIYIFIPKRCWRRLRSRLLSRCRRKGRSKYIV